MYNPTSCTETCRCAFVFILSARRPRLGQGFPRHTSRCGLRRPGSAPQGARRAGPSATRDSAEARELTTGALACGGGVGALSKLPLWLGDVTQLLGPGAEGASWQGLTCAHCSPFPALGLDCPRFHLLPTAAASPGVPSRTSKRGATRGCWWYRRHPSSPHARLPFKEGPMGGRW